MNGSGLNIQAMLFAAGLGTRLKPWTDKHPKALAEVAGKSLLQRNIEYLASHGILDVVVNVHHFPDQIIEAIEKHAGWGSRIRISDERAEVLETGGGLLNAATLFQNAGLILCLNADILTDLDLTAFIHHHRDTDALISLAVTNRPGSRKLLFNSGMQLCGWKHEESGEERIARREATVPYSFSGITALKPDTLSLIKQKGKFSLLDVFLDLAVTQPVLGYDHSGGVFIDVGKPESLTRAAELFK
jgi:NDP-sugar pyrophosphorylase family protein